MPAIDGNGDVIEKGMVTQNTRKPPRRRLIFWIS
jgi:hypothetical protein